MSKLTQLKEMILSPKSFADFFGLSEQTVYKLLWANKIPGAFRVGDRWRINVQKFIEEKEQPKENSTS